MGHVAVLGAGAWGTALAVLIANNGYQVCLWARDVTQVETMTCLRHNPRYLPGIVFPPSIRITINFSTAITGCAMILVAVPSHAFCSVITEIAKQRQNEVALLWATKGFEPRSGRLLHQVVNEHLPAVTTKGILSGPSFAAEVGDRRPTAVVLAGQGDSFTSHAAWFRNAHFRVYTTTDIVGVEIGGATKNIYAVAAGVIDGIGLGANSRAALITRALREMRLLATALGAQASTVSGLSGIGDLILTCTDDQSRNRQFGLARGRGMSNAQALASVSGVVESKYSCQETIRLARQHQLSLPICDQVYRLITEDIDPYQVVEALMRRTASSE